MGETEKGVTVYTASMFHGIYQYDIAFKLSQNHHLSCVLPSSIGLYPTVLNIEEIFDDDKRITVIMKNEHDIYVLNDILASSNRHDDLLFPITVQDFLKNQPETEVYILFDLPQKMRVAVGKILIPKRQRIVISVGQPEQGNHQDVKSRNAIQALNSFAQLTMTDSTPHPLVFPVDSILDIRDIMFADVEEKGSITLKLQNIIRVYQHDADKMEEIKKQKEKEIESCNTQKLLEELELIKKQLEAARKLNEAMLIVSESAGIEKEDLQCAALKLVTIKERYERVCCNPDGSDNEEEITKMQDETAAVLADIAKQKMTSYNREAYENLLINMLSQDVWRRLNSNSREYLVSARMNYDAMVSSPDAESIDYSGVCLQITKVLDEEMADRIYHRYKSYLTQLYSTTRIDRWPEGMTTRLKSGQLVIASEERFTLGSVSHTLGVDGTGKIMNQRDFDAFCKYAELVLYKPDLRTNDVISRVKDIAITVEKVRRDYRNPSAHRATLSKKSAEECMFSSDSED